MGRARMRIAAVSVFLLVPFGIAGIGAIAAETSPACQRLVRTYVTVPVRNRVSKATAAAWAKWGVAHPNWKPRAHSTRPRYIMTRQEGLDKVNFACQVQRAHDAADPFSDAEDIAPSLPSPWTPDPTPIGIPFSPLPRATALSSSGGSPDASTADSIPTLGDSLTMGAEPGGTTPFSGFGGGWTGTPGSFLGAFGGGFFGGSDGTVSASSLPADQTPLVLPTPEPTTLSLLALGVAVFTVLHLRKAAAARHPACRK